MCLPERPSPDAYDHNEQVKPHFAQTPGLTPLSNGHHFREGGPASIVANVKEDIKQLYQEHGLRECPTYGLYWAGSKEWTDIPSSLRPKTVLLVVELTAKDILRWREIDKDARAILSRYALDGDHGICVRYYHGEAITELLDAPAFFRTPRRPRERHVTMSMVVCVKLLVTKELTMSGTRSRHGGPPSAPVEIDSRNSDSRLDAAFRHPNVAEVEFTMGEVVGAGTPRRSRERSTPVCVKYSDSGADVVRNTTDYFRSSPTASSRA